MQQAGKPSRRRFIQLAAAFGTSAVFLPSAVLGNSLQVASWQGIALGAEAQITLAHPDHRKAKAALKMCLGEINRLESIFSLYRVGSVLNRLNENKTVRRPPPEFTEVISAAITFAQQSEGMFDISIQPLWKLYHVHFSRHDANPQGPSDAEIARVLPLVDYRRIEASHKAVTIQPGMELTLNGIAQGYITERITQMLGREGFQNALVNLGEYQALGQHPSGRGWRVGIPSALEPWKNLREIPIPAGMALATSGAYGTRWSQQAHHLLSPGTGRPQGSLKQSTTVIAKSAMEADALATIMALRPDESIVRRLLAYYPNARVM